MSIRPHPVEWTRDDWLAWRREGIGGSDVAALAGLSTFGSPMSVYLDKLDLLPDDDGNEAMRWGQLLEPAITVEFEHRTGLRATRPQALALDDDFTWRRVTLDGVVGESPRTLEPISQVVIDDATLGVLEVKTTSDRSWDDGIPDRVACQLQWNMGVAGVEHAWLAVLHQGRRLAVHEIDFDDRVYIALCTLVDRFWHEHVEAERPPPADSNPATTAALNDAFRERAIDTLAVPLDHDDGLVYSWASARDRYDAAKRELDSIENTIKAELGEAVTAEIAGEPVFTWKPQQSRRIDIERLRAELPDVAAQYTTATTSRRFLAKRGAIDNYTKEYA